MITVGGNLQPPFQILGPIRVRADDRDVQLPGLARALLVALLLHARKVRARDELIDALWGEFPPHAAAASLHNLVSSLRRALGASRV